MRFCKVFSKVQHVSNVLWAQTGVCSSRRAGAEDRQEGHLQQAKMCRYSVKKFVTDMSMVVASFTIENSIGFKDLQKR